MEIELLLNRLATRPETIEFPDVIRVINERYEFVPTAFRNHDLYNEAGRNSGACRLFAFARLHDLDESQTLALFGAYYRVDVLRSPEGSSHPNIRRFMVGGWAGIEFEGTPLRARSPLRRA